MLAFIFRSIGGKTYIIIVFLCANKAFSRMIAVVGLKVEH